MSIDPTSFLHDEVRRAKKRLEKALREGDSVVASRQARRVAELLRELARYRSWGGGELLELAREYEELARKLSKGVVVPVSQLPREGAPAKPLSRPVRGVSRIATGESEVSKLDREFDAEAEKLIARADVTWNDIAGLEDVKKALMEAIYYSLAKPEIPVKLEPPRRLLLYGPPGTGKTMLAMAASNMLKATFFNVSVDRVLSRYVGDSPRMIAAIFRAAYRHAPSIIFFDEIETLVARRDTGKEAATGVVQTFLTELDGFKTKKLDKPVIVIAATNKPWMLDEAIISRFEKRIYIPLPDKRARIQLFKLELEKKGFKIQDITYEELAELTEGYSGRDIRNICKEAVMMMLRRANPDIYQQITRVENLAQLQKARYRVKPVTRQELIQAIHKVKPATTPQEIKKYIEWTQKHGTQ
ncbi:MAG: ATP-binding protein [Desulfurococcales archaeon]|nr:ATP-binding protein [Desulfurococcales archaeon]